MHLCRVYDSSDIVFMVFMNKYIALFLLALLSVADVAAQTIVAPKPTAEIVDSNGELHELSAGDEFSGEAPVVLRLSSNAEDVDGYSLVCTWNFYREGEETPYLVRHDKEVEIEIRKSGATIVQPVIVYTSIANSEILWEFGTEEYEPFSIVLSESRIEAPNAFSPNGDGINDYYNVYNVQSIISFSAAIYNRWGQKLYSWGIDEIHSEECGWDGTYKGTPVKDGVYFVVINAVGADGRKYEIRRDVNLLRGYSE